jgi:putative lipoprotein
MSRDSGREPVRNNNDARRAVDRLFERDRSRQRVNRTTQREFVTRGTTVRSLPPRHERVTVRDRTFYRADDVFYVPVGSGPSVTYRVVPPPPGVYVSAPPSNAVSMILGGLQYLFADDTYYLPTVVDGRRRYQVVEPPIGASITVLPETGSWVVVGNNERLWQVGDAYYRPMYRDGRQVFVRVHYVRPSPTVVYGTVSYRGRLALPSTAIVTVQLIDVRGVNGPPGSVVVEQQIANPGPAPIPFTLQYDSGRVRDRGEYGLAATITANGRVLFATLRPQSVVIGGATNQVELVLDPARDRVPDRAARVTGRLMYRERMALPANAEVVVRLIDANNASGREEVLAEQVFYPQGNPPIPFELRYDPFDIDPMGIYIVEARIRVNDSAMFYNTDEYRVITRGYPDDVEVWLERARF